MAWSSLRDSEAARHCAAVAMVGLGQYADGAGRLEELAKTSTAAPRVRAGMFDQAALAWLLDKSADKAMADVTQALMLVPGAPDLLVDRAQIEAARNDYQAAQVDLDTVLAATPNNGIELIFRASTRRHLNDRAGAKADIDKALQALPRNPDAWLEKGILARLDNDEDGARAAWSKVIELAPDSAAALTAKQNLDLLDGHAQQ
jgi:tetratricopeptide (TPR) repeat protein